MAPKRADQRLHRRSTGRWLGRPMGLRRSVVAAIASPLVAGAAILAAAGPAAAGIPTVPYFVVNPNTGLHDGDTVFVGWFDQYVAPAEEGYRFHVKQCAYGGIDAAHCDDLLSTGASSQYTGEVTVSRTVGTNNIRCGGTATDSCSMVLISDLGFKDSVSLSFASTK
jgi:hypothetical protein